MRRIIPDNSVIVASYYPEIFRYEGREVNLTARARPLRVAIEEGFVTAFAPHGLVSEFIKVSHDKAFSRQGSTSIVPSIADTVIEDFTLLCQNLIKVCSQIIQVIAAAR